MVKLRGLANLAIAGVVVLAGMAAVGVAPVGATSTTTLYVATTGSNSGANNCQTQSSPCLTIGYALTQGAAGDLISVGAGTFDESQLVLNYPVTIRGVGAGSTTIDVTTPDSACTTVQYNATDFVAFTINGATTCGLAGASAGSYALTGVTLEGIGGVATGPSLTPFLVSIEGLPSGSSVNLSGDAFVTNSTIDPLISTDFSIGIYGSNSNPTPITITGDAFSGMFEALMLEGSPGKANISGNTFTSLTPNTYGSGISISNYPPAGVFVFSDGPQMTGPYTVSNNTFSGYPGYGVVAQAGYAGYPNSSGVYSPGLKGTLENFAIANNSFNLPAAPTASSESPLLASGTSVPVGLFADSNGGNTLSNVFVIGNSITSSGTGAADVWAASVSGNTVSGITIQHNALVGGSGVSGVNNTSGTLLHATDNWWGCATGPNTTGCTAAAVTSPATIVSSPWLTVPPPLYVSLTPTPFGGADTSCAAAAYATIQSAVDAAVPGTTVHVCAGTFPGGVTIPSTLSGLTLDGAQQGVDARTRTVPASQESIITSSGTQASGGSNGISVFANNVTVDGFTIQDPGGVNNNAPGYGVGVTTSANVSGIKIVNDIITNNVFGIYLNSDGASQDLVQYDLITTNNQTGSASGDGIYTDSGSSNISVDSNLFAGNTSSGIVYAGSTSSTQRNISITNNQFTGTGTQGGTAAVLLNVSNATLSHNVVSGTGPATSQNDAIDLLGGDSTVALTGNVVQDAGGWAVHISTPYPSYAGINSDVTLHDNSLGTSNALGGLSVASGSYTSGTSVDATNNWWGSSSGPYNASTNANGTGAPVTANVTYSLWCSNSSCTTPPPPPSPTTPPPPPSGAVSSSSGSADSSTGTATATNDNTTASGTGVGALTVAQYSSDPVGAPSFSSNGEFFDVALSSGNSFTSTTVQDCNLNGGNSLQWWNPQGNAGAGAWEPVSPAPTYSAGPPACVSVALTSSTSPTLAELTGTVLGVATTGSAYTALAPKRLLDTRTTGAALGPNASLNLTVTGGSVPSDATAVALNLTATNTTATSYLSVYPAGEARPVVSNLNWTQGETVPNLVIVPVGSNGQVTIYNYTGNTNVVVDLEGYFAPETTGSTAGSYVPLTPARITDTRSGSTYPNAGNTLAAGGSLNVQVTGEGGVPSSGVTGAILNVTVTGTTAAGYLTAYPEGATRPLASNLNWGAGETVANRVVVPVSSTGMITLYNYSGSTDVVVDVSGYFTNGSSTPANASLYNPITPIRVLDTRTTGTPLSGGATLAVPMAGIDGIASNATAVVTNVTAANTTAASFFTVYPGGTRPTVSDVNWMAGQTVPNLTVATLGSTGSISIYNHAGSAAVIVDAVGYFSLG